MWSQISLQTSHCQAILFQLLTTDSRFLFSALRVGTSEKNPWRLTLKACFVWPKVQSVEMGLPKEKVGVKTEHWTPMGSLNSPKPCSDLLSFLANSGMETSTMSTVGPQLGLDDLQQVANASILPSYLTLPEMVGKFIELETWMTHPKSSATYKTSLSFWHYRKFLLSFQFLGQKYSQPM